MFVRITHHSPVVVIWFTASQRGRVEGYAADFRASGTEVRLIEVG